MYSFEQLMAPVWSTDTIYDESLTMVRSNGIAEAPLLFTPKEIFSVTSADKTKEYEEGRDWEVHGNMFCLAKHSRIFAFEENELIFDEKQPGVAAYPTEDGKWSLLRGGHFFHDRQIVITYKKEKEEAGFAPEFCGAMLPLTMAKLRNKEQVNIVLYGDSISEGFNSSGITLTTPFLPTWGKLFAERLLRHYGTDVKFYNNAKSGTDSRWGIENAKALVGDYTPDLAIIAFGMNDRDEAPRFAENIKKIKDIIIQASPKTEFILCASTIGRPGLCLDNYFKYQSGHREELLKMQEMGTAIADFYSMHMFMLERKRFIDLTGNNVNHPNDFLVRCHAQLMAELLIEK